MCAACRGRPTPGNAGRCAAAGPRTSRLEKLRRPSTPTAALGARAHTYSNRPLFTVLQAQLGLWGDAASSKLGLVQRVVALRLCAPRCPDEVNVCLAVRGKGCAEAGCRSTMRVKKAKGWGRAGLTCKRGRVTARGRALAFAPAGAVRFRPGKFWLGSPRAQGRGGVCACVPPPVRGQRVAVVYVRMCRPIWNSKQGRWGCGGGGWCGSLAPPRVTRPPAAKGEAGRHFGSNTGRRRPRQAARPPAGVSKKGCEGRRGPFRMW